LNGSTVGVFLSFWDVQEQTKSVQRAIFFKLYKFSSWAIFAVGLFFGVNIFKIAL